MSETKSKHLIHYAHCVKFIPDQLDRHPHSLYESREAEIEVEKRYSWPLDEYEFIARHNGKDIACESDLGSALALASYELMFASRAQTEREAIAHEKAIGNPKFAHVHQ